MIERRKFVRLNIDLKVKWKKIPDKSEDLSSNVDKIKNISRGGICLTTSKKLKIGVDLHLESRLPNVGDCLSLEVELPKKRIIKAKGRVVWVSEMGIDNLEEKEAYNVGVEFIEMNEEDKEEIYRLVFESLSG